MNMGKDIGLNLGSANTVVYLKGRGVVQNEPTVMAIDCDTGAALEVGSDALLTVGRVPGSAVLIEPMKDNTRRLEAAERIIRRALKNNGAGKAKVAICEPALFAGHEKSSLMHAVEALGAKPYMVNKAVAAAIGAGKDITAPDEGGIVIHIGEMATEIVVIAAGRVAMTQTLEVAGGSFTDAVSRFIVRRRRIEVSYETAARIKHEIGAVWQRDDNEPRIYNGLRTDDGLPKNFKMRPSVLTQAFEEPLSALLDGICDVIDNIPDDIYDFVAERGILLTGGGSLLWGLAAMIGQVTGLHTLIAESPEIVAAAGAYKALAFGTISEGGILAESEDFM